MTTKLNPAGIITVNVNNIEYDVTILGDTVMVKQNDFYMNFTLPITDEGLLDFSTLDEDYIIGKYFSIESNMPFVNFNRTSAKNAIVPVLEKTFNKEFESFDTKEKRLVSVLETIANDVVSLQEFLFHLHVVMKFSQVDGEVELKPKTIGHLILNSITGNGFLTNVIEAVHTAKSFFLNNTTKINTDFVSTLPSDKQTVIYIRLLKAGLTAEEAEFAMNSRICDLEDKISIKDI